jgi:PPOX class probable F420-dependent enzyme
VSVPRADRPQMAGYDVRSADEGLLDWAWAQERLTGSRSYWLATTRPDGRPHVMPVWAVWDGSELWFSTVLRSRKARNLLADPRCVLTTEDPSNPVVVEGTATFERDPAQIARFVERMNAKYDCGLDVEFQDPDSNATIRVAPRRAFGLADEDLVGTATRWTFGA